MGIQGLKFVVTGGAEGIGAATARMIVQKGGQVCLADINEAAGESVAHEIRGGGGNAWFVPCDVTDDLQLEALMRRSAEYMGGIDVLHNNAGVIDTAFGGVDKVGVEHYNRAVWDRIIAINLTAPMFAAKAALPWLKKSSNASIITSGSVASFVASPSALAYCSSKGGVAALSKALAVDLAVYGIRSNCYCPGVIQTELIERYLGNAPNRAAMEKMFINTNLVPRFGDPSEIAELVCFLAGDESRFVNGAVWLIDGGSLAWRATVDAIGMP